MNTKVTRLFIGLVIGTAILLCVLLLLIWLS